MKKNLALAAVAVSLVAMTAGSASANGYGRYAGPHGPSTPSVDIQADVQISDGHCHASAHQNSDYNVAYFAQRCRSNSAHVNQNGYYNRGHVRQR